MNLTCEGFVLKYKEKNSKQASKLIYDHKRRASEDAAPSKQPSPHLTKLYSPFLVSEKPMKAASKT